MERLDQLMERKRMKLKKILTTIVFLIAAASAAEASLLDGELNSPGSVHPLLTPEYNIVVEIGLEYMHPDLPSIHHVVVENQSTSTAVTGPTYGDVQAGYPDTFAQTLKAQALLIPSNRFTVAVKTYLPLNGLTQMDTGNVYQPEFVLYRAESQRPRILLTSGIDLSPHWRVGIGLDVGFSVAAEANIFLQSGPGTVSDQRISAKVKPSLIPQASVSYDQYEFTVRGENKAEFDLTTNAGARVFSNVSAGVDFSYAAQSALYYQPWQLELAGQNQVLSWMRFRYGISYELWGGYQVRAAVIQTNIPVNCPSGAANCTPQFSSGIAPDSKPRNIWVPEAGWVFDLSGDDLEFDYQYKDSIFKGLPIGQGNYLDPPRHDLKVGYTHHANSGLEWNVHGAVSRLTEQVVVKSDPNSIGAPGYKADGWLYGGGVSVTVPFKN
jgi:hypothetical protein